MIILIFHPRFHTFERYELQLFEPMPYTHSGSLSVANFRGSSNTSILWTTKPAMDFWERLQKSHPHISPICAFSRIGEGRHVLFSKHYTGEAFDLPCSFCKEYEAHPRCFHLSVSNDPFPDIFFGCINVYVLLLQDALTSAGYDCEALDGHWGNLTEHALRRFCNEHLLSYNGTLNHIIWKQLLYHAAGSGIKKYPHH